MQVIKNPGDLGCNFHAGQEVVLVMRDDEILAGYRSYRAAASVADREPGARTVYATVTETGDFDKRIDD
jgi:hypothetical protein